MPELMTAEPACHERLSRLKFHYSIMIGRNKCYASEVSMPTDLLIYQAPTDGLRLQVGISVSLACFPVADISNLHCHGDSRTIWSKVTCFRFSVENSLPGCNTITLTNLPRSERSLVHWSIIVVQSVYFVTLW